VTSEYVKTVSRKGQVVIPAQIRRRLGVKKKVLFREQAGKVVIEPVTTMEEAFGAGGATMYSVAREISAERRKEAELESA